MKKEDKKEQNGLLNSWWSFALLMIVVSLVGTFIIK